MKIKFSPISLRPFAWYDANDVPGADGKTVDIWFDKSRNNRHAIQSNNTFRPLIRRGTTANRQSSVNFDGTDDYMFYTFGASMAQPFTIFLAARAETFPLSGNNQPVSGIGDTNKIVFYCPADLTWSLFAGATLTGPAAQLNRTYVNYAIANGTSSQINIAGTIVSGAGGANLWDGVRLGCGSQSNSPSKFWDGDIFEVIIFDRVLSAYELKLVSFYLTTKYGVAAIL